MRPSLSKRSTKASKKKIRAFSLISVNTTTICCRSNAKYALRLRNAENVVNELQHENLELRVTIADLQQKIEQLNKKTKKLLKIN